ncbi:MAG: radical SAM protein [Candidatus Hydrogenedentes bacterium]|nr:radical SAM protein [Candidatus Hydrogenedentota bacterium]
MGLLALAACMRKGLGADCAVINQRLDNCTAAEIGRRAREFGADVVGLSAMTTTACLLPDIISAVRGEAPEAFIVLGGPYVVGEDASSLAESCADAAVPGEGELAFEQLLRARFEGDGDLSSVPGLIWRSRSGDVVVNTGTTPVVADLDTLPLPAYDLIDLPAYWRHKTSVPMIWRRYATLFTSRGCVFQCIWCHKIFGSRVRMHSAERVLEEMDFLHHKYGVEDFDIQDDTFNYDEKRVLDICQGLTRRNRRFKLAIPNGVRGDILSADAIHALADAGLYMCMFALESGSERIQKWTRKNLNIPKYLEACRLMAERRVFIQTACHSHAHTASFFITTPYPGTPLYAWAREHCPEKLQGIDYALRNSSTMRVNLSEVPDEVLFDYQRKAVKQFFLNPRRLYRILRDHPQRVALPAYVPIVGYRMLRSFAARNAILP